MVEVFKTNVTDRNQASMLIDQIHKTFSDFKANFDLEDCDNILRVQCTTGLIQSSSLINLLNDFGFDAEVLPDDLPTGLGSAQLSNSMLDLQQDWVLPNRVIICYPTE